MNVGKHRYRFTIVAIVGKRVDGVLGNGRPESVDLSVLVHGRRAARLERHPDGTEAKSPKYNAGPPLKTAEDKRSASDYIRSTAPKGIAKAGSREREALRLKESGEKTFAELVEMFGVSPGTMSAWLSRAREAREDERNLGRTG